MSTELERWETAPWDPHNYDRTRRLLTSLATKIVLAEAILIVLFNGIILFLGIRNKELRTSAANLLFLSLCTGNMLFGVFLIVFRIMDLQPDFLWAKDTCSAFAFLNVYSVCCACCHMALICAERFAHIVLERTISRRTALLSVASVTLFSILHTTLHFCWGGGAAIGVTGIVCYPTRFGTWIGQVDIFITSANAIFIAAVYTFMFVKIRHSYNRAADHTKKLDFGVATQQEFQEAKLKSSPSQHSSGGRSLSKISPRLKLWSRNPQRAIESRVLLRGILSFAAFSFVLPTCYFVWIALTTGARAPFGFEIYYTITKLISELSDPIIILAMDRHYRAAMWKTLPRWIKGSK